MRYVERSEEEDVIQGIVIPGLHNMGYRVARERVLGAGVVADIIAEKANETLIIEIKTGNHLRSNALYQARSLKNTISSYGPRMEQYGRGNVQVILGTTARVSAEDRERFKMGHIGVISIGRTPEEFQQNLIAVLQRDDDALNPGF